MQATTEEERETLRIQRGLKARAFREQRRESDEKSAERAIWVLGAGLLVLFTYPAQDARLGGLFAMGFAFWAGLSRGIQTGRIAAENDARADALDREEGLTSSEP